MTEKLERPKFLPSLFSALAERADNGSLWRIFPAPVISGLVAGAVAYFIPANFWSNEQWEVAAAIYTGVLTLNGLILALSWSAFSRIYESISAPSFCSFLRRNNLLNKYIVTISFIHALQLLAVTLSAAGLFVLLFNIELVIVDRILFAFMVFGSIYAIQQASSAVGIMHDLLWQKSIFDEHQESLPPRNVVPMDGNRGE